MQIPSARSLVPLQLAAGAISVQAKDIVITHIGAHPGADGLYGTEVNQGFTRRFPLFLHSSGPQE
ncbi:hypothetical protein AAFF27_15280 [Xylophilus sp. GW821-FHT01B05]